MKHFGIYNTSGDVRTAIDASALTKPYVAIVSGALDYNTVNGTISLGEWSVEDINNYVLHITDDDPTLWGTPIKIANSSLYHDGTLVNYDIYLSYQDLSDTDFNWYMQFVPTDAAASHSIQNNFYPTDQDSWYWTTGASADEGNSNAEVYVEYDNSAKTFTFNIEDYIQFNLTTIDPSV